MMPTRPDMQIRFTGRDHDQSVEVEAGTSLREALGQAGILASTVIVSFDGVVIPHSTLLENDCEFKVTTVSSGG